MLNVIGYSMRRISELDGQVLERDELKTARVAMIPFPFRPYHSPPTPSESPPPTHGPLQGEPAVF